MLACGLRLGFNGKLFSRDIGHRPHDGSHGIVDPYGLVGGRQVVRRRPAQHAGAQRFRQSARESAETLQLFGAGDQHIQREAHGEAVLREPKPAMRQLGAPGQLQSSLGTLVEQQHRRDRDDHGIEWTLRPVSATHPQEFVPGFFRGIVIVGRAEVSPLDIDHYTAIEEVPGNALCGRGRSSFGAECAGHARLLDRQLTLVVSFVEHHDPRNAVTVGA